MTPVPIIRRSAVHYWRHHLAIALGVLAGTAALTGALIVGDSMRSSLRTHALRQLGGVEHALVADRFFREQLAADLEQDAPITFAPAILLRGSIVHADARTRANEINVYGVDQRFWSLDSNAPPMTSELAPGGVAVNQPLADRIGAKVGDDVLVRFGNSQDISAETVLGRKDQTVLTRRLTVERIISAEGMGNLSLTPGPGAALNVFLPLDELQDVLGRDGKANVLLAVWHRLIAGDSSAQRSRRLLIASGQVPPAAQVIEESLSKSLTLDDVGLAVRIAPELHYVSVESSRFLIEPPAEQAIRDAAAELDVEPIPILAYLANAIERIEDDGRAEATVPYSTVAAIPQPLLNRLIPDAPTGAAPQRSNWIVLNDWAASDLDASPGDLIRLQYYVNDRTGTLATQSADFTLMTVVPTDGTAGDPGFVPEYPGVTDASRMSDWDPPFPVDLSAVRDKDEDYWEKYKTTPKAFVSLATGRQLWTEGDDRFGSLTSIRFYPPKDSALNDFAASLRHAILNHISPEQMGFNFDPVRQRALEAGRGSTDFGGLFIGFSLFVIVAAALLVALLFRLTIDHRAAEVGLMVAVGVPARRVLALLLREGAIPAIIGTLLGLPAAYGYAWLMLTGLRTWWSDAANAPFITLSATPASIVIGAASGLLVGLVSIYFAVRSLKRASPRSLLAGRTAGRSSLRSQKPPAKLPALALLGLAIVILLLPQLTDALPEAVAFFLGGTMLLASALLMVRAWIRTQRSSLTAAAGTSRLAVRSLSRNSFRSLATISLIAGATFVITALQAFHLDVGADATDKQGGTGGFSLYARTFSPIPYDPSTGEGRRLAGLDPADGGASGDMEIIPFRLRDGETSSCLNLYLPTQPRVIGATDKMIQRGGFRFTATMAQTDAQRENPWLLLSEPLPDGAIPAIGDEAAVKWQLHLGLGQDLSITDERGNDVTLRFVALLSGSALQDEIIVSESAFKRMFPSVSGYGFFLIEAPADRAAAVRDSLEREFEQYGFDAESTTDRLRAYLSVQNTYLITFQMLGGLGLVLGTFGVGAVLLRNVWERRGELALMQALGFRKSAIAWMVFTENAMIVVIGLLAGFVPSMLAVAPRLLQSPGDLPWVSLAAAMLAVLIVGLLGGAFAVRSSLKTPLLAALRRE